MDIILTPSDNLITIGAESDSATTSNSLTAEENQGGTLTPARDPSAELTPSETRARLNASDFVRFGGGGTNDYEELENKPAINGVELIGDKSTEDLHLGLVKDLGSFDIEDYGWEFWPYLDDKTESGFFKVYEEQDGFAYFFRIERAGDSVYQEVWSTEEGGNARTFRTGWYADEEWSWGDPQNWMTSEQLFGTFYTKNETDVLMAGKVDTETLGSYYTDAQVDEILEDNYYTADQVDTMLDNFVPSNMIPIAWADLVQLRDDGGLVPGAYYRITDYNFITTKAAIRSGDHPFDIIVLAVSESMLSENAHAARHEGDHYFEREITTGGIQWLYTLYVDSFADEYGDEPTDHGDDLHPGDEFVDDGVLPHPISGDDVPVLYKTNIDEYDLDDPDYEDAYFYEGTYEFDGDEYDLWSKYEGSGGTWYFAHQYALTPIVVEDGELIVSPHQETKMVSVNLGAWELKYCLDNDKALFEWAIPEGKGVIYYLRDEFGNAAPYDFKNIMFQRKKITAVGNTLLNSFLNKYGGQDGQYQITALGDTKYLYTFSDDTYGDASLFGGAAYNSIEPYILDGKRTLNDIVLNNANGNHIGLNCHNITGMGGSTDHNTIGPSCEDILLLGGVNNTLEGLSRMLTFDGFNGNKCGRNFSQNFGKAVEACTFGIMCQNNNLGQGNSGNRYGSACYNLTFGNYTYNNNFGNNVTQSTFGNYCYYNDFKGWNNNLNIAPYSRYCTIEENARQITLNTTGGGNSNYLQFVTVCKGVSNITAQPLRNRNYEQIYYKTGRTESAV